MSRKHVLVVEDSPSLLELTVLVMKTRGYSVSGVGDGHAALEHLQQGKTDLVILDVNLPKIDGFEVCRHIKSNDATSHIPVIFLTARNSKLDFAMGEEVGADHYVVKPYKSESLAEAVRELLSR